MKQTLHCQNGNHSWTREVKRGRKPINCPKHAVVEAKPKAPKEENLAKARVAKEEKAKQREAEAQQQAVEHVEYLRERVKDAQALEEKAYAKLLAKKTDKNLDEWLKLDGRLMAEVTALKAHEAKVA